MSATQPAGDVLATARHAVVVAGAARNGVLQPLASPQACWSDGQRLWCALAQGDPLVPALRADPACAVWVAGDQLDGAARSVAVEGRAKVFSVEDPLGLAVHGVPLAAAMTALQWSRSGGPLRAALSLLRDPEMLLPGTQVALRIDLLHVRGEPAALPKGVSPPLPPAVPAALRRVLGRRRTGLVSFIDEDGVRGAPVAWSGGWRLHGPPSTPLPSSAPALLAWEATLDGRPVGLALHGEVAAGSVLRVRTVQWWDGDEHGEAEVASGPSSSPIVLPD